MQEAILKELSSILLQARSHQEMTTLLAGILTPQELEEIIRRWHLLTRLHKGQTQREIASELGVSLGKIARGSRLLKYGPDDFRSLFNRIQDNLPGGGND